MWRGILAVLFLVLAASNVSGASVVQLVNDREALDREEEYLRGALEAILGEPPQLMDGQKTPRALGEVSVAVCRLGRRPEEYYRHREILKKWVSGGGVLWLEHGGAYLLLELELGRIEFPPFLPAVRDEVFHLAMVPAAGVDGPPGIGTPLVVQSREDEWLFGRVRAPGIYGHPQPVVPNAIFHHTENLLHTPGYRGWVPKESCPKYPGYCAADFAVLSSNKDGYFFPHQPTLMEIPYGRGRIYVYNLSFSLDVMEPGPAAERLRAAWLRWAMERPVPEAPLAPTPAPTFHQPRLGPALGSKGTTGPNNAKPTGTPTPALNPAWDSRDRRQ